ncbi:MAG: PIN domain-containing protein [Thermoprotei archaeon]|nr:PIN domain-containing protein [Thermoprotei archaeon]
MSRKSSPNIKILLDTSFLLPILGFETSHEVMSAFQKLYAHTLYYNDISILEALWKIVKVIKGEESEIKRILEGIIAIRNTMEYAPISEKAIENSINMYKLGHRDMIDNLLYSIALSEGLRLLTVDKELINFIEEHGFPKQYILTLEELTQIG